GREGVGDTERRREIAGERGPPGHARSSRFCRSWRSIRPQGHRGGTFDPMAPRFRVESAASARECGAGGARVRQGGGMGNTLTRVVVRHGYTAHPGKHWFGWLAAELAPHGITVEVPALPGTEHPEARAWTDAALAAIGTLDEHTA